MEGIFFVWEIMVEQEGGRAGGHGEGSLLQNAGKGGVDQ